VKFAENTGWIESSLIDDENRLVVESLQSFLEDAVGKTRMAIYKFRKANGLLDFSDYAGNFSMDTATWNRLNQLAAITMPS
jgi:hypothetical protein